MLSGILTGALTSSVTSMTFPPPATLYDTEVSLTVLYNTNASLRIDSTDLLSERFPPDLCDKMNVESARSRGAEIIFLSGNLANGKIFHKVTLCYAYVFAGHDLLKRSDGYSYQTGE